MFKPAFIVLGVSVALFLGGFMLFTAGWDKQVMAWMTVAQV